MKVCFCHPRVQGAVMKMWQPFRDISAPFQRGHYLVAKHRSFFILAGDKIILSDVQSKIYIF